MGSRTCESCIRIGADTGWQVKSWIKNIHLSSLYFWGCSAGLLYWWFPLLRGSYEESFVWGGHVGWHDMSGRPIHNSLSKYWHFFITATSPKLQLESQKLATWLIWLSSIHFWSQKSSKPSNKNLKVWPLKWKLSMSTFLWCCSRCCWKEFTFLQRVKGILLWRDVTWKPRISGFKIDFSLLFSKMLQSPHKPNQLNMGGVQNNTP